MGDDLAEAIVKLVGVLVHDGLHLWVWGDGRAHFTEKTSVLDYISLRHQHVHLSQSLAVATGLHHKSFAHLHRGFDGRVAVAADNQINLGHCRG